MTIERFNCTYQNDFNDVYHADIDILPDGGFVRYEDHESAVVALENMIKFLRKELDEQVVYYQEEINTQAYSRYLEGMEEGYEEGYDAGCGVRQD